jgi:hypothetical protein
MTVANGWRNDAAVTGSAAGGGCRRQQMTNSDAAEQRDRERRAWQVVRRMLEMDIVKRSPGKVAPAGGSNAAGTPQKGMLWEGRSNAMERTTGGSSAAAACPSKSAKRDRSASTRRSVVPPSQPCCRSRFGMHYDDVVAATTSAGTENGGCGNGHLASWSHHVMHNSSPTDAYSLRSCRSNSWRQ